MKEVYTENQFVDWVSKAKKGERVVYFDGFLMFERQRFMIHNPNEGFPQKIRTAMLAWKAYLDGLVMLVQKRRDGGEYEYIAIRS